jgi:hypothetical protein
VIDPDKYLCQQASLEALRKCLYALEETIGNLLQINKSMLKGDLRDEMLDRISALDSIGDVMRQALDAMEKV